VATTAKSGVTGAVEEDAAQDALPSASPVHVLPEHDPLAEPVTVMFSSAFSASMQLWRLLPVSTYWPSQKSAPFGCEHCASQPPLRSAVHYA
jgi:hypothetical protein